MSESGFLDGYLCALQFIACSHGEATLAEDAMKESGFSRNQFTAAQQKNGFEHEKMMRVINEAFNKQSQSKPTKGGK